MTGARRYKDHADGNERDTGSTILLVTEEVLHPIGKIQLLLIGWNLPDRVESCRRCKHASTMKDDRTHATANPHR